MEAPLDFIRVPELDGEVFAGKAIALDDAKIIGFHYIPRPRGVEDFDQVYIARVVGDSLIDERIGSGDWVAFKVTQEVEAGQLLVISTPYGNTVKFVYPNPDGTVVLQPGNRNMRSQTWLGEELEVRGLVVASGRLWEWG